jgi:hypothetical protein
MFISNKEAKSFSFYPYDDCPCESSKKYKFCCYEKSKAFDKKNHKYTPGRMKFEGQKIFRETDFETCFGFNKDECSQDIIGAHSLQNNGVLNKISTNNHVYNLTFDISNNLPTLKFEKIGKNQASKFTGFCKDHDKAYFSCIEDTEYKGTDEQNFWFAFRAFCFELHRKKRLSKHFPKLFKEQPQATRNPQILINYKACELDIKDKEIEYERFKEIYESGSYEKLETFKTVLPYKVGFTGTTAVAVNVDITGEEAANVYNYDEKIFIPSLYLSVIPRDTTTLIIVSRHVDDSCYKKLIEKLNQINDQEILLKYISFCLAEYSENVYFSPKIIDKLSSSEKDVIISAFSSILSVDPDTRLDTLIKGFKINLFKLKQYE